MDRNQIIGFVLIGLLFIVYIQFFAEDPSQTAPANNIDTTQVTQTDKIVPAISPATDTVQVITDSSHTQYVEKYGIFSPGAVGKEEVLSLENDKIKVDFSTKGGSVHRVNLKEYKTYYGDTLILLDHTSSQIQYTFKDTQGHIIPIHELYYEVEKKQDGDTLSLVFSLNLGENRMIRHIYSLAPNTYQVKYTLEIPGLDRYISSDFIDFHWSDKIKHVEHDLKTSRTNATVKYYTVNGDFDRISEST
ncbi:MAG: membrane protein insertase YidC, partial [Cyclobacteriaceae bacterium]|nr:membrane protein insertase YidC [Cyclobacteriaceae bacterium]